MNGEERRREVEELRAIKEAILALQAPKKRTKGQYGPRGPGREMQAAYIKLRDGCRRWRTDAQAYHEVLESLGVDLNRADGMGYTEATFRRVIKNIK